MSSPIVSLTNVVPDAVRDALNFIIGSVICAHSVDTENADKSLPASTPLSTATTASETSPDDSMTTSNIVAGNDSTVATAQSRSEIPAPKNENGRVPMSEELGEKLFAQGYDSDGFILDFNIDTNMHLLNDYNSEEIAPCSEGTGK